MVTAEKTQTSGFHGSITSQLDPGGSGDRGECTYARQTFTFAKVYKDSRIGEAGVMLDTQQVAVFVFLLLLEGYL